MLENITCIKKKTVPDTGSIVSKILLKSKDLESEFRSESFHARVKENTGDENKDNKAAIL
jgi:hypothetical protein